MANASRTPIKYSITYPAIRAHPRRQSISAMAGTLWCAAPRSCEFWHNERFAIIAPRECLRLAGEFAYEFFALWIERQPRPKHGWSGTQIDAIFAQIISAPFEGIG